MQMGRVAHHESRVHAFIHLLLLPPLRDMGMYRESPRRSNKVLACGHSPSPPFIWRWPSDRFLRDVPLLGVNEWVSMGWRERRCWQIIGIFNLCTPPMEGKPLPPPSPALQVPSLSPSPTLSGVFWPYLSIPDPNPALLPCRGSCSEISKSCK